MYHKLVIVGRLGRDPELRYMADGTAVASLSVASDRKWTDRSTSQPVSETTWFRVSVWGKQAENVNQYLSKGKLVLVEGRLKPDGSGNPRIWEAKDGEARASFEVHAETVRFLSSKNEDAAKDDDDDIDPF